jgi:hypothetical protein
VSGKLTAQDAQIARLAYAHHWFEKDLAAG